MSLIPHELSTKLVNLSKLLKQSGELTAHINRLRDQLATTGPSVLAAQRLDASYSRAIQLSWDEQNLTAACVRGLESVLRSVSSGTKRGAAAEGGTRGDSARGDACARAAAAATTAADGAGGASVCGGGAAAAKGKRARLAESEEKKRPSSPPPGAFPDAQLELVSGDAADAPLCGAVPAGADFVVPVGGRVVSRLSGPKVTPQLWAIGIVLRHIQAKGKYVLRDDDLPGAPPCCTTKCARRFLSRALSRTRRARLANPHLRSPTGSPACRPDLHQAAHDHCEVRRAAANDAAGSGRGQCA